MKIFFNCRISWRFKKKIENCLAKDIYFLFQLLLTTCWKIIGTYVRLQNGFTYRWWYQCRHWRINESTYTTEPCISWKVWIYITRIRYLLTYISISCYTKRELFLGLTDEPFMMDIANADVTTEPISTSSNVSSEVDCEGDFIECETVGMYALN